MMKRLSIRLLVAIAMATAARAAFAAPPARDPTAGIGFEQRIGTALPLSVPFTGPDGVARPLRDYFGGKPGVLDAQGRLVYQHNGGILIVTKPIDGNPATGANGGTIGFAMTPEQADAWWQAGQDNGGTAVEDPPGLREGSPYYLAYLRDPSGNKLCALSVVG